MHAPDDFDPTVGKPVSLGDGLCRIVAPNPSPMTYRGTNTYLVGTTEIAVIDPGPASLPHLQAILGALTPAQKITHIIVTHSHLDHSPLARPLADRTGAPVYAFGKATAGRSGIMQTLADRGLMAGGEGVDTDFAPDRILGDMQTVAGKGWSLQAIHTPGHLGNHICLAWGDRCFVGDHVMGWASSLVSPPDGDLTDFMSSCARLQRQDWRVFYPGHGAPIDTPAARLDWLVAHRNAREASILDALATGPADAATLARQIYVDTPPALLGAATRNVLAHLIDLHAKTQVEAVDTLQADAVFRLASQ